MLIVYLVRKNLLQRYKKIPQITQIALFFFINLC